MLKLLLTKYAVPLSLLRTVTFPVEIIEIAETVGVGAVVSTTIALLALKDPAAPAAGKVNVALLSAASFMVPLLSVNGNVAM